MATVMAFKWYGMENGGDTIFKIDTTASLSTAATAVNLPSIEAWTQIASNGLGDWVVQGSEAIAVSHDDGDSFSAIDVENDVWFDLPGHPNTGNNDYRADVTFKPYPRTLFWDGTQFVVYGTAYNGYGGMGWTSPDGDVWTSFDLEDGGIAWQNNDAPGAVSLFPSRMTYDRDRQGRFIFMNITYPGGNPNSDQREAYLGVEDDIAGTWDDIGFETILHEGSPDWYGPTPFLAFRGYHAWDRYGIDVNPIQPEGEYVTFNSHFKTDGSNVMMVFEKTGYSRNIYKFDIGHWGPTVVYNSASTYYEKPWPVTTVGTDGGPGVSAWNHLFYPQEVVFTGDYWLAVGGWKNVDLGYAVEPGYEFAYATSVDGNAWTVTRVAGYRTDCDFDEPGESVPEVWDLVFDGRYVMYFGRDVDSAMAHSTTGSNCVLGRFDTTDDTWEFFCESGGKGWGHAAIGYNVLNSFIYTDLNDPVISLEPQEADTHYGVVLRPNAQLNLGLISTIDFRNIRGTGSIYLTGNAHLARFNSISFTLCEIKMGQKNLLLTETEVVKVKGMPLGVGGRFAQLNHYVRNIYGDHPVAYLPLNDRDEDINGTPQNSETDDLQQEVF